MHSIHFFPFLAEAFLTGDLMLFSFFTLAATTAFFAGDLIDFTAASFAFGLDFVCLAAASVELALGFFAAAAAVEEGFGFLAAVAAVEEGVGFLAATAAVEEDDLGGSLKEFLTLTSFPLATSFFN